jgi:hypothetical protein
MSDEITRWAMRLCPKCNNLSRGGEKWCLVCLEGLSDADDIEVVKAVGARTTDPGTSHRAFLKQQPRSGSRRAQVLAAYRLAGLRGLTAKEAAGMSGVPGAWKRVSELAQGGHIVETGAERDGGKVFVVKSEVHHAAPNPGVPPTDAEPLRFEYT